MTSSNFELTQFGELCKHGRARMHMTRPEMVRKLVVSVKYVSVKYVSDVESGKRRPSEEYICRVTGILGLSSAEVRLAIEEDILNGTPSTENVLPFQRL